MVIIQYPGINQRYKGSKEKRQWLNIYTSSGKTSGCRNHSQHCREQLKVTFFQNLHLFRSAQHIHHARTVNAIVRYSNQPLLMEITKYCNYKM